MDRSRSETRSMVCNKRVGRQVVSASAVCVMGSVVCGMNTGGCPLKDVQPPRVAVSLGLQRRPTVHWCRPCHQCPTCRQSRISGSPRFFPAGACHRRRQKQSAWLPPRRLPESPGMQKRTRASAIRQLRPALAASPQRCCLQQCLQYVQSHWG